jgi:hypothetical protein
MSTAPKLNFHLLHGSNLSPEALINSYLCDGFSHICQSKGHEYGLELDSVDRLMAKPESFFDNNVEATLGQGTRLFERQFSQISEKASMLADITKSWESFSLPKSFSDELILVIDELFTNAIFNAPVVDLKTQNNPGLSRQRTDVGMHPGKFGKISLAYDRSRLVVSCSDPYGTLNLNTYLQKVLATYEVGADYSMNFGAGGAGIGSFIIFNSASSLYFGVKPGIETLISCVFPLHLSGKKRAMLPKHLHCIQL